MGKTVRITNGVETLEVTEMVAKDSATLAQHGFYIADPNMNQPPPQINAKQEPDQIIESEELNLQEIEEGKDDLVEEPEIITEELSLKEIPEEYQAPAATDSAKTEDAPKKPGRKQKSQGE